MEDDKTAAVPASPGAATGTECKQCTKPGRLYNICGQDEMLCEEHYERRLNIFNDFGSN